MLTITNHTQSTPNFKARVTLMPKSPKIGKYFEKIGINTNRAMIGGLTTTVGAGAVSLAKPDLISNPDAAKLGLVGGIAAILGAMIPMVRTRKTDVAQNDTDMIAKAQAELEATAKAEQKAQARAERIEKRLARKAERKQARDNVRYHLRNGFRNYCKFHYNNEDLPCGLGTVSGFAGIIGACVTFGNCAPVAGTLFLTIGLGVAAWEGIMYKLGEKYHYDDRCYRW